MKNVRRVLLAGGIALAGYVGYFVATRIMRKSSAQVGEMEAAFDRSCNFVERVKLLPVRGVPLPRLAIDAPARVGVVDSAIQIYQVVKAVIFHHPRPVASLEAVRFVARWTVALCTVDMCYYLYRHKWKPAAWLGFVALHAFKIWAITIERSRVPRPDGACTRVTTGYHLAPLDVTIQLEDDLRGMVLENRALAFTLTPWIVGRWFCGRVLAMLVDGRTLPQNVLKLVFGYTRTHYESVIVRVDPDEDARMRHALGLHYPLWVRLGRPLIVRDGRLMGRTGVHRVELRGFFSTCHGTMRVVSIPYRYFVASCDMFARLANESSVHFALTAVHTQTGLTEQVDLGEESIEVRVLEEYLLTTRYRRADTIIPNFHQDQLPVVTL